MNQSDTGILDIDQSQLSISCGIKKRGKQENSGCSFEQVMEKANVNNRKTTIL